MKSVSCCDCDKHVASCSTDKELLIDYLQTEASINYTNASVAMEISLGWLAVPLKLEEGYVYECQLRKTGQANLLKHLARLLTDIGANFELKNHGNPGYL